MGQADITIGSRTYGWHKTKLSSEWRIQMSKREREITATAIRAGWILIKSAPLVFLMPDGGKIEIKVMG